MGMRSIKTYGSAAGKRLAKQGGRRDVAGWLVSGAGYALGAAATATGVATIPGLAGGAALAVYGNLMQRKAAREVAKARAIDNLVSRARTGNTLGVKGLDKTASLPPVGAPQPNGLSRAGLSADQMRSFVEANHRYGADQAKQSANPKTGGGVFEGGRGFQNPNNQKAAQRAKGNKYKGE